MFDIKINTAVSSELLSVSTDIKPHLAITHTDDDTYLTSLAKQARAAVEQWCGIAIGTQTLTWTFDFCAGEEYRIPHGPIQSITSINRKVDINDYDAIVANTDYEIDGEQFKTVNVFSGGRCKILYVTGYTALPDDLKRGMLEEIAYRYEHRGDVQPGLSEVAKSYLIRFKDFSWD